SPDSVAPLYVPVHRYWTRVFSSRAQSPLANPAGAQICFLSSAVIVSPTHLPSVGEPCLMSTATRTAAPCATRIILPIGGFHGKCRPRITLRAERDSFICTNVSGRPSSPNCPVL